MWWSEACHSPAPAAAATVSSLLRKHLPPDDQLPHTLLRRQRQQTVVLTVQTHVQEILFRKMVGDQVGLRRGENETRV